MKKALSMLLMLALLPMLGLAEQKPIITTTSLPQGMSGVHYGLRILAEGEQPMRYAHAGSEGAAGSLPKGMKLSDSGILSGTPTVPGDYAFSVRVTNPAGSSYISYSLHIGPYDESKLNPGGTEMSLLGEGQDSLDGVANAINGGRVTRQGDTLYFLDRKGYLYSLDAPYDKKPTRMFSALKYQSLDSTPDTLYYYQRYLDNEATRQKGVNTFVTRIAEDPIVGKGRNTLLSLYWEDFSSLSVTGEVLLYIGYDHVMGRVGLERRGAQDLRMYHAGREVKADLAIPFNGKVYFREPDTGHLYSAWLDGELAVPVVNEKVIAYTIGKLDGGYRLYYAAEDKSLYSVDLSGGDKQPVGDLKASQLNANERYLFFADAANKNLLTMIPFGDPANTTVLSDQAVDQIYTFEQSVAYQRSKPKDLYVVQLGTDDAPVRIIK